MPIVRANGKAISCKTGANLRQVLLKAGVPLYNGNATVINCRSLGTCGTCAVRIEGASGAVNEANWRDRTRRSLPPHDGDRDLRLACQTQVLGDISVTKYDGFWGQGTQPIWTAASRGEDSIT